MKGVYNKLKFLALDSGSKKWGYAIFDGKKITRKGIIETNDLEKVLLEIKLTENLDFIVVGRRRGALEKLGFLKDIEIITVSEVDTTMEARDLYFSEFPPKGLVKFLPKGLRVPDRAVDDFAAIVIGKRFLNSSEGIYRILKEAFLKAVEKEKDLEKETVFVNSFYLECCECSSNDGYIVEVNLRGCKGRAFSFVSVRPSTISLKDILHMSLFSLKDKAIFVATLNALYRYQGKVNATLHCIDRVACAERFVSTIEGTWGEVKICMGSVDDIFLSFLSKNFDVAFLNYFDERKLLKEADIFILSGKNLLDGSLSKFLSLGKPVICYGPTMISSSFILDDVEGYCPLAK